jgi:enoyl-CoA hydratase
MFHSFRTSIIRSGSIAARLSMSTGKTYKNILTETRGKVGLITLNRPKALNALCNELLAEVIEAGRDFDKDSNIGCIVITGSEKTFAAGADIKEMQPLTYVDCYTQNLFSNWIEVARLSKPVIAAVSGYALGGGCELAMTCDMIIAADNAKFGQPEIQLGVIPGGGGTQRLIRAIGKSKAMHMILTGDMIDAQQAERDGLVSKVVPKAELLTYALQVADKIAGFSQPAVAMCKETVNAAYEMTLDQGLRFERRMFHSLFALEDQKEGMSAFAEKRKPVWKNK